MRLSDLKENDKQLDEILPALAAIPAIAGGVARGAAMVGGAALRAVPALARGVGSAVSQGAKAVGNVVSKGANVAGQIGKAANLGGLEGGQMDPAQAAQAAKEQQEQKKQVQDQIKQTELQLVDLRKQLAGLG